MSEAGNKLTKRSVAKSADKAVEKPAAAEENPASKDKPLAAAAVTPLGLPVTKDEQWVGPYEYHIIALILLVALVTRYYGLTDPAGVVFDEYHFGRFVNQYCARTYLFDIHPPLGKLTLLFFGKLFGYDHTVCAYNAIQDVYAPTCKYWVLRATAAAFGSLTAPLMYLAVRGFDGGIWAGVLCAAFFIFDNLNLIESRLVLIDSQLIFWCAAALVVAQRWWRRWREDLRAREQWGALGGAGEGDLVDPDAFLAAARAPGAAQPPQQLLEAAGRMMGGLERNLWCLAVGVTTSSAISIKWTGLATPGMIGMESFFGFFFQRKRPVPLVDLLKILAIAAVLYYTWFVIHFAILTKSGDGDAFMRVEFQRTLFNNTNYDPLAKHPGYLTTFIQLNQEMLAANARIELRHNWESVWWEWPLNLRGLLYYSKDMPGAINRTKLVYLLGNPVVIWLMGILVATAALCSMVHLRYQSQVKFSFLTKEGMLSFMCAAGYCLWVYALNLLPYILVSRSAFIYHYMPALMYAEIIGAMMVEILVEKRNMPNAMKVIMALVVAGFLFYAPWVYSTPLTGEGHARRRLLKRWD